VFFEPGSVARRIEQAREFLQVVERFIVGAE